MEGKIRIRVAALITDEAGRVLLVRHRKDNSEYWLLPGGGLEFGEHPPDSLRRELQEELGARIRAGDLLFVCSSLAPNRKRQILHLIFAGIWEEIPPLQFVSRDPRVSGALWVEKAELRTLDFHPDMKMELLNYLENGSRSRIYLPVGWVA